MLQEILEIIAVITDQPVNVNQADDNLITDIGLSSFDVIQLIAALEDKYTIRIPTHDLAKFTTPRSIAEYIKGDKV